MKYNFAVVGAGAWGTALANLLAKLNDGNVIVWAKENQVINSINNSKKNELYLPKITLEKNIYATNNIEEVVASYVFYVTPAQYFHSVLTLHKNVLCKSSSVVICSKGIDIKSGFLMSKIYKDIFSNDNFLVLSGPSFAYEIAKGLPAALTLASPDIQAAIKLSSIISSRNFRLYPSNDVIGVQLGGAIKNIYAIGSGIVKGLNYGDNAGAAFLTRSIAEIIKICEILGGKKDSIFGLSGVGDVLLTSSSNKSRNFMLGSFIGKGENINNILKNNITVAEGYFTAKALYLILKKKNIETPILDGIYNILYNSYTVEDAVNSLLDRPLKNSEFD